MRCDLLPLTLLTLPLLMATADEAKPDPRVIYAPDVVGVDRLFMVILRVPQAAPAVAVQVPEGIKLLDQTRLPAKDDQRRYYFRATARSAGASLVFALPDGPVTITLPIWSYDDLRAARQLKSVQLPRRWPLGEALPELKDGVTVTPANALVKNPQAAPGGGAAFVNRSDDELWDLQPDSTIPRWHWVNVSHGCPVHGTEIYRKQAYYPWIKPVDLPLSWQIECPVGHERYPSNNFAAGDFTSGPFCDDGLGAGYVQNGERYGFIAELSQRYCHYFLSIAPVCARSYAATGDVRYLHKALVAMCRLAVEHAYLATMTNHRHHNDFSFAPRVGPRLFSSGPYLAHSGFTVYPIDQPSYLWTYAESYDLLWPDLARDTEIVPFLQRRGFAVKTAEDVRRFIEENLFAVWMQGTMDGAIDSNEPFHQRAFARTAEVLNYRRGAEFMDWLYDREGKMRVFVPNGFYRDGAPYESTGGYNSMHVTALGPIIASIEHLRQLRPEIYPESKYPALSKSRRYRNVFDFCMDSVTIDRSFPQIGDGGGWPQYQKLPKITFHDADFAAFEHAYQLFGEPKFAWALARSPAWQPSPGFPFTRAQVEAAAAKWPDTWNDASSLHDGYGVAILRGGQGDAKRAFWLRYGMARGHNQDDLLDIGYQAHQGVLLTHMGYPRNWGWWEYSWSSHHLARQFPQLTQVGRCELFAEAGPVHLTEARATTVASLGRDGRLSPGSPDHWQRRLLALVDVDADHSYTLDVYRLSGGKDHWWAFHGQEGEFTTHGLTLKAQRSGTLAGPDVPYADEKWLAANGCSKHVSYGWRGENFVFAHLYNVQKGRAEQPWHADWALKTGDGLHLRLTSLSARAGDQPMEVNVCDGKAASGGSPYEMKWLMLHHRGELPARSQVVSLLESYRGNPVIQEATPLALSGTDEAGFGAVAARLRTATRVDTVFAAADPTVERTAEGDFRFAGRFGLYGERDGAPVTMTLIGGTRLSRGQFGLTLAQPEYRGRIARLDRAKPSITITPAPPRPAAMVGAVIHLVNGRRRVAAKVLAATATTDGAELQLADDPVVGTGQVTGTNDQQVLTGTPFVLHGHGYYEGARLINAAGTTDYRLAEVRHATAAHLDADACPTAKKDQLAKEFPVGSWFTVYDYGVGDEVIWPYAVSVARQADGSYQVTAPVEVKVVVPGPVK